MRIAFAFQIFGKIFGQIPGGRMLGWKAEKLMPEAVRLMIGVEWGNSCSKPISRSPQA